MVLVTSNSTVIIRHPSVLRLPIRDITLMCSQ